MQQPIRVVVLEITLDPFGTQLALIDRKVFPGFKADHFFVMDFELNATLDAAETAVRFDEPVRLMLRQPTTGRFIIEMRPVLLNQFLLG